MSIALLIGNGVNRLNNAEASWEHVLKELTAGRNAKREVEVNKHKPFALLYEEILLAQTSSEGLPNESVLKRKVAELVSELRHNEFHKRFMGARVRHILTTNYDYTLEKSEHHFHHKANLKLELKYSVYRRRKVGEKFVWHIHGEASSPATITLGYDQYSGYLQKLRGYATVERTERNGSPFKQKRMDFDKHLDSVYSWLDVFFRDDVHIVGLTMDFAEIDLWWALTYKARLKARGFDVGQTHFHDWHYEQMDEPRRAKQSLLSGLGVRVHDKVVAKSFEPLYDQFLRRYLKG